MSTPGFPRVDRQQIDTFVRALFCHADAGGYVQLRAFRDDRDGTWRAEDWPAPQIEAGFANLINEAEHFAGECAAASVPVVFAPPIATFVDRQKAAERDIRNGVTLSVECDQHPTRARDRLVTVLGPPTIALASGGEWIDPSTCETLPKLHLHWRLTQPSRTFAEHVMLKEARRAAMVLIGADASGVPLVHPMRWAGTWHRKGKPRLATIVECNPDVEIALTDALARLKAARGNGTDQAAGSSAPPQEEAGDEAQLIGAILRAEDYHGPLASLAMRYLLGGMPDAQTVQTLRGIMLAVDPGRRDYKNGVLHKDRWLSRYNDIPRAISTARGKIDETGTASSAAAAPWPEPARFVHQELEAAMPFPVSFLPGPLGEFAWDVADRMQCPVDFIAIPLIIQSATLIGKDFRLAPKAADDWTERPCLWGGIIAASATMKSPAFQAALAPIRWLQREFRRQHEEDIEAHNEKLRRSEFAERSYKEAARKAAKTGKDMPEAPASAPDRPQLRRLLTDDPTVEALVELMQNNPRGLLLFRDELSAWFASFNQYRPGADRQFYLECHSGGSHFKDRKSGVTLVDDLYLNICGGVQPEIVNRVLAGGDLDGMTPRFGLLIYPDRDRGFVYIDRRPDSSARHKTEAVMKKLLELDPERFFGPEKTGAPRALRFDDSAQRIFIEWYTKTQQRIRAYGENPGFSTHLGKYPGLFARLAIVHHLIRFALGGIASPVLVDEATARAVESFLDHYLESHARRIYRLLSNDRVQQGAQRIARWIASSAEITEFTARNIRRKEWSGLTSQDEVNAALDYLENVAGWVRAATDLPGPRGGRPSTRWIINPLVERR